MPGPVNIEQIKEIAKGLEPLLDKFVFVGGSIIEFYTEDPAAEPVRPTMDIDIVVEITGYHKYTALEEELYELGFSHDSDSKIICRYNYQGIRVDIMPTDEEILGFSNRWYKSGINHTIDYKLSGDIWIQLLESSYFLASKFEAFRNRGQDRRTSHDFEDIIYFLNNRNSWVGEVENSDKEVNGFLKREFNRLLNDRFYKEDISAHLPPTNRKKRLDKIVSGIKEII